MDRKRSSIFTEGAIFYTIMPDHHGSKQSGVLCYGFNRQQAVYSGLNLPLIPVKVTTRSGRNLPPIPDF
ncbi:MAG: hypothetical protein JXQ30_05785, partial [Spirochaetes bacterium]|nr:hypothetical protein [Spirochaetota bacterium]